MPFEFFNILSQSIKKPNKDSQWDKYDFGEKFPKVEDMLLTWASGCL